LKQLKYWRMGILLGVLALVSVVTAHIEKFSLVTSENLLERGCADGVSGLFQCMTGLLGTMTVTLSIRLGVLVLVTLVVYAFTLTLKGISTYLPWYLAIGLTGGIAAFGHLHQPVDDILIGGVSYLYPDILRDDFAMMARWATPVASVLMKIFAAMLTLMQVYVVGRIAIGTFRQGDSYRQSNFYQEWSADAEPAPGVKEVFREAARRYRLDAIARWIRHMLSDGDATSPVVGSDERSAPEDFRSASRDAAVAQDRAKAKRLRRDANRRARRVRQRAR